MICGKDLERIESIDVSELRSNWKHISVLLATDVRNPMTGPNGATAVYGPQKGASENDLINLERGMIHLSKIYGPEIANAPGAGAAGGTAAGLCFGLNAKIVSGATIVKTRIVLVY